MKSAKVLFDTIYGKCNNGDMYSWKACKPKEHDNVVLFDVRQKADNQLLCSCTLSCFEEYTHTIMIILLVVYIFCLTMVARLQS